MTPVEYEMYEQDHKPTWRQAFIQSGFETLFFTLKGGIVFLCLVLFAQVILDSLPQWCAMLEV